MRLIGITGKARSGKDAIAKFAWSQYGFTRIAFADAVKLSAQAKFGLTAAQTWDDELKEVVIPHWNMTPRQMFQMEGTEAGRNVFGGDLWIKRFMLSYNLLKDTDDIIVPDVRFDNEAEALRSLGGIIIEVRRGQGPVRKRRRARVRVRVEPAGRLRDRERRHARRTAREV